MKSKMVSPEVKKTIAPAAANPAKDSIFKLQNQFGLGIYSSRNKLHK